MVDYQRNSLYLSGHNTKLNPTSVTLLCIHPIRGLIKTHTHTHTQKTHDKPNTRECEERIRFTQQLFLPSLLQTWHHSPWTLGRHDLFK